jgi:hypothetical protein
VATPTSCHAVCHAFAFPRNPVLSPHWSPRLRASNGARRAWNGCSTRTSAPISTRGFRTVAQPIDGGAAVGDARFKKTDDGYVATFVDHELEYTVDRLRWDRHESFGQLAVACGLAGARTVDGSVSFGTFNFSSTRARRERAKEIRERVRANVDIVAQLDEVCRLVLTAAREGDPAIMLRDVRRPPPDDEYEVEGFAFRSVTKRSRSATATR